MTTFDVAQAAFRGARAAGAQARADRRAHRARTARTKVPTIRRVTLTVGALASFTYAAASWHEWAGLVVGGLSALFLEQSLSDD